MKKIFIYENKKYNLETSEKLGTITVDPRPYIGAIFHEFYKSPKGQYFKTVGRPMDTPRLILLTEDDLRKNFEHSPELYTKYFGDLIEG